MANRLRVVVRNFPAIKTFRKNIIYNEKSGLLSMPKQSAATQFSEEDEQNDDIVEDFHRPPRSDLSNIDEMQMLRARIDEQSSLIMILKQRADDAVARSNLIERRNEDQLSNISLLESRIAEESKKFTMLETRFFELASNHEEMIRIKDEYKASNERLRTENIQLRRDNEQLFSKQLNLLTEECESMRRYNETLARESRNLEHQNRKLEALLKEANEGRERERQELTKNYGDKIVRLEDDLKISKEKFKVLSNEADELKTRLANLDRTYIQEKERFEKEKEELLGLVMERGRIIQDKQTENKTLQLHSADLQRQLQAARQRFQDEIDRVDSDTRIQRMKDQLLRLQNKYDSLSKAHEAFKKHTGSLLDSERLLNNQLATIATYTTVAPPIQYQTLNNHAKLPDINLSHPTCIASNSLK